jgi:hypothetical protein
MAFDDFSRLGSHILFEIHPQANNPATQWAIETNPGSNDNLAIRSTLWGTLETNWFSIRACIGSVHNLQGESASPRRLRAKRGNGILLVISVRHLFHSRIDISLFRHCNRDDYGSVSSFNFRFFCPNVLPYDARIFTLVKLGDTQGVRQELLSKRASISDTTLSGDTLLHVSSFLIHRLTLNFYLTTANFQDCGG